MNRSPGDMQGTRTIACRICGTRLTLGPGNPPGAKSLAHAIDLAGRPRHRDDASWWGCSIEGYPLCPYHRPRSSIRPLRDAIRR